LGELTTGDNNIAIGTGATNGTNAGVNSNNSTHNIFMGLDAGGGDWADVASEYNVGIGNNVMDAVMNGALYNTAVGYGSLGSITSGDYNTVLGANAGASLTSKSHNTMVGQSAGSALSGGDGNNNLLGQSAGGLQVNGYQNVAIGSLAWYGVSSVTNNSNYGVYVGNSAGQDVTTGDYNVMLGHKAGKDSNPDNCIFIGNYASASVAGTSHEIIIGSGVDTNNGFHGGGTETIRIGRASDFITNDFGENATWTHSSDRRIKKDIKDTNLGLEFILKLQPKEFKKKAPSEYPPEFIQYDENQTERKNPDRIHYGFLAQEVKEVMDDVGHSEFPVWKENRDGMQELGETELITPLVKAVQELSSENKELKERLNDLEILIKDKLGDNQ